MIFQHKLFPHAPFLVAPLKTVFGARGGASKAGHLHLIGADI